MKRKSKLQVAAKAKKLVRWAGRQGEEEEVEEAVEVEEAWDEKEEEKWSG